MGKEAVVLAATRLQLKALLSCRALHLQSDGTVYTTAE